jgi:hypothetical protein
MDKYFRLHHTEQFFKTLDDRPIHKPSLCIAIALYT